MNRIGIISGSGDLPISIGKNLLKKKYEVIFFNIKNHTNLKFYKKYNNFEIEITSFSDILKILKKQKIDKIIMVGNINRPSIKEIKFDFNTIKLIKSYFLESKGDDKLLTLISNIFLKNGFDLFDWKVECKELFSSEENLTYTSPKTNALKNKNKGLSIYKTIGKADITQSLIVQNELILGVECIEGTDALIKRCFNLKKKGDNGILLKFSKYNQHKTLDVPTIGIKTVKNIKKYNYDGLFIEKNNCVILEKEKVIDFCNQNNLFLSTIKKIV